LDPHKIEALNNLFKALYRGVDIKHSLGNKRILSFNHEGITDVSKRSVKISVKIVFILDSKVISLIPKNCLKIERSKVLIVFIVFKFI